MSTSASGDEQCKALTESGERCQRPARDDGFCYQHDASDETVEESEDDGAQDGSADPGGDDVSAGEDAPRTDIGRVRQRVASVTDEVVGHPLDGITSVDATDDGWRVGVEVVEREAVPDTQDILGRYELRLDEEMAVTGYQRTHRYRRGDTDHNI